MNNFQFIDVKPSIDRNAVNSIKEAIYSRAKEKSNAVASKSGENYTSQTKSDVMDIARESFQDTSLNPFNQFIENVGVKTKTEVSQPVEEVVNTEQIEEIEQNYVREVKRNIESVSNQTFVNSVQNDTMAAARKQFNQGTSLAMSLNFLNTQAAIRMAQTTNSKINFDIMG